MKPGRPRSDYLWAGLAVVDLVALAYVVATFDWGFDGPTVGATPAGWIVQYAIWAVVLLVKLTLAAAVVATGYAIAMEFRGAWQPRRWVAALTTLAFLAVLGLVAFDAFVVLYDSGVLKPALRLGDRLEVFEALAKRHRPGQSIGAYLAFLVLAAYLAEKYLLRWWRLRWPVPLAALVIVGAPAAIAYRGEAEQRDWVAAQQWKAVAEKQTWLEALAACRGLGPGWRLPRRFELKLHVASQPGAIGAWKGPAWTPTTAESGRNAVVVEFAPRRGGVWRANMIPWRDLSPCEIDGSGASASERIVHDWFTRYRERLCEVPVSFPGLYPSTVQFIAQVRGRVVGGPEPKYITAETQAATICIKPTRELPVLGGRRHPKEKEYSEPEAFLADMRAACDPPRQAGSDPAACAAFVR